MVRKVLVAVVLVAAFLAGTTWAGVNVTSVSAKKYRNATSVAVQATVVGDDDTSAVVQIFQRGRPSASFDSGMVMFRRPGTRQFSGRILWVPNFIDTVDFYIEARDGATVRSSVDTVTKAGIPQFPANGGATDYYADAVNGSDSYDGTAATWAGGVSTVGPKKTIQAAVNAMNAAQAPTGSTVRVADGEYHEAVVLTSWTNGYSFRLLGASRDSTIICGANPNVEAGRYDGSNAISWAKVTTDPDPIAQTELAGDSVYACVFPSNGGPADSTQLIVLGYGEQLHRKTSVWGLLRDSTLTASCFSSTNAGELSGWFWRNDSLYVKRANGQAPSVSGNHFGYRDVPLWIKNRNWHVSTLTVRYAGSIRNDNFATETAYKNANDQGCGTGCQAGKQNPGMNGHCIQFGQTGVANTHASGSVLFNLRVYGANATLVDGNRFANGVVSDSITVAGCIIDGLTIGTMHYAAGKCRAEEGVNGTSIKGQLISVYNNTISGTFNGIISDGGSATDTTGGSFNEYSYNTMSRMADDAFELDNGADINVLALRNSVRATTTGFSGAPAKLGTIFVIYNTFAYRARGAKLGGGNTAPTLWYHNTFYPDSISTLDAGQKAVDAAGGGFVHNVFRNNIFGSRATSATIPVAGQSAADSTAQSASIGPARTNDFNWNVYYTASGSNIASWWGTNYTLATIKTGLVWEKNNGNGATTWNGATGQHFRGPYVYNFGLGIRSSGSSHWEFETGQRLTGVNTAFGYDFAKLPPASLGFSPPAKPDKGAFEFNSKKRRPWWRRWFQHS